MKKLLFFFFLIVNLTFISGQKSLEVYLLPQSTSINNSQNKAYKNIYSKQNTFSYGGGITGLKRINKGIVHGPIRNGPGTRNKKYPLHGLFRKDSVRIKTPSFRSRKSLGIDLSYSKHQQKFNSIFNDKNNNTVHYKGSKQLSYIQLGVYYQETYPLSRYFNYSFYIGPKINYLIHSNSNNVNWETENGLTNYETLENERKYFKSFYLSATLGLDFQIKIRRWTSIILGCKTDWGITSSENNKYNTYNLNSERPASHNLSLGLKLGVIHYFYHDTGKVTRY